MAAQIFVVSGASGSGKTTLVRALQDSDPELRFSVSYTTRPSRPGEVDGKDYCFVSAEEFRKLLREGLLVEYVSSSAIIMALPAPGLIRPWEAIRISSLTLRFMVPKP